MLHRKDLFLRKSKIFHFVIGKLFRIYYAYSINFIHNILTLVNQYIKYLDNRHYIDIYFCSYFFFINLG